MRWLILLVSIALMLNSCDRCETDGDYTVAISPATTIDMHGPLWSSHTASSVSDTVMMYLQNQFNQDDHLFLVSTSANVHVYIDSVITDSYEWDETYDDPCYGDHGWLYQLAFPPEQHTYHFHRTQLTLVYTVLDSVHLKMGWGRAEGRSEEYIYQPPGDSTHCYQYEVAGNYDHRFAMDRAAEQAFHNIRCEIRKMMEP